MLDQLDRAEVSDCLKSIVDKMEAISLVEGGFPSQMYALTG